MITMKQARTMFANRSTVRPAKVEYDQSQGKNVLSERRVRTRNQLGTSFRAWAKAYFKTFADTSPKLKEIIVSREVRRRG